MRTVSVTEFKAKCLGMIAELRETGEGITITHRGQPVADLTLHEAKREMTIEERRHKYRPGQFAHMARVVGDLTAPLDEPWEVLDENSDEAKRASGIDVP